MLSAISSNNSISTYSTYQNGPVDRQDSPQNEEIDTQTETAKVRIEASQKEQQQVQHLKVRDQEVRAHEQAHLGAAGGLARGGASFSFEKGSDGVSYAIGGEVNIDTSEVSGDAEATLRKAETIRRAALAPTSPSSQDMKVASQATAMANKARAELFQENKQFSENEVKQEESSNKISFSV